MKSTMFLFAIILSFVTAGCVGGGPRMKEIELTEAQQRFKTKTTFKNGVVSVEIIRPDGSATTLNSLLNYEDTAAIYYPRPPIPGTSTRVWLLSENTYDGINLVYSVVSWDKDDPTDYLAAGWWRHYPPGTSFRNLGGPEVGVNFGVYIDGPELDLSNPPVMPASGEVTYTGTVGGLYRYHFGSDWGSQQVEAETFEFDAVIELTANFADNTIQGCIGCTENIETQRLYSFPLLGWRRRVPVAPPADYELRLGATRFNPDGIFENTDITVTHPERTVTQSAGLWAGQFSNIPDADGNPRRVVGFNDVAFSEADGSRGSFVGLFAVPTQAALKPGEDEGR